MKTQQLFSVIALLALLAGFNLIGGKLSFNKSSLLALSAGAPGMMQEPAPATAVDAPSAVQEPPPSSGPPTTVENTDSNTTSVSPAPSVTPSTLAVTLTANGQSTLNIPFTIPPPSEFGNTPELYAEVAWSANIPNAQCFVDNTTTSYVWYNGGPYGNDPLPSSSGTYKVFLGSVNGTYLLGIKCTYQGQSAEAQAQIIVGGGSSNGDAAPAPQQFSFTANGQTGTITVAPGSQVLLAWTSSECTETDASGSWSGEKSPNGQIFTDPLYTNQSYTLSCGQAGSENDSGKTGTITVYVSGNSPSQTTASTQPPCEPYAPGVLQVASKVCHPSTSTPSPTVTAEPASNVTDAAVSATLATVPAQPAATTQLMCDQTAQSIVTAAGGCSAINPSTYPNIYAACCPTVTKDTLLKALDTDLANGMTQSDTSSLLDLLNTYLSQ